MHNGTFENLSLRQAAVCTERRLTLSKRVATTRTGTRLRHDDMHADQPHDDTWILHLLTKKGQSLSTDSFLLKLAQYGYVLV